jgi:hypothetical protein
MGKRLVSVASLIAALLLVASSLAGCGSGGSSSSVSASASPSPSPSSSTARGDRLIAEAKAYARDIKPAMRGEAAAFRELLDAQHDFARLDPYASHSEAIARMHAARKDLLAIAKKVRKVKPPSSMRASHRSLERYFALVDESFGMLLTMIDTGSQSDFAKAQKEFKTAQDAYSDWYMELSNRYVVVVGKRLPIKMHFQ